MSAPWSQEAAFTNLYLSYYPRIYAAAFSLLRQHQAAQDITQLVFTRLWEGRETIHPDNVEGYLVTMAKNAILNQFRSKAVQARYRKYLKERFELGAGNVEDLYVDRQQREALQQAIGQLPARQKEAWHLCREQGLTYREISQQMGITKGSVKELLQKAASSIKSALRKFLFLLFLNIFLLMPPPQCHKVGVNSKEPSNRKHDSTKI